MTKRCIIFQYFRKNKKKENLPPSWYNNLLKEITCKFTSTVANPCQFYHKRGSRSRRTHHQLPVVRAFCLQFRKNSFEFFHPFYLHRTDAATQHHPNCVASSANGRKVLRKMRFSGCWSEAERLRGFEDDGDSLHRFRFSAAVSSASGARSYIINTDNYS